MTPLTLALCFALAQAPASTPTQVLDAEALATRAIGEVSPLRLASWHDRAAGRPHVAGTEGDARQIEWMQAAFEELGLEVERQDLWVLLAEPESALVRVLPEGAEPIELATREKLVDGDPFIAHDELDFGWNAYSGSGTVRGQVVYANHGRKEDFERLVEMGVEVEGKIVVARYGGNYRGYKAKYAELHGAAGLIIYSDPEEVGFGRGMAWPDGGWANETSIQRGSIKTLPHYGDPQTPFVESTKEAKRIDLDDLALPKIPVQPIGWGAAREILARMDGAAVPEGWSGALELPYRLTGGDALEVELTVRQKRVVKPTANVLGTLRGSEEPEKFVVIGCHHDSWNFGAGDATCGLIGVFEAARVFAELRDEGVTPRRSIVFAAWGAEEFGIIGSSEWVETNVERIRADCLAYLNLDAAAMGTGFRASASPMLHGVLHRAARLVPHPSGQERTVYDVWARSGTSRQLGPDVNAGPPKLGNLGGGSDHVGFLALGLVPSASLSGGGSRGNAYHTNYDHLAWYRAVVGEDYRAATMIAQMAIATTALVAHEPILPYDIGAIGTELRRHLASLSRRGRRLGFFAESEREFAKELEALALRAKRLTPSVLEQEFDASKLGSKNMSLAERVRCNEALRAIERSFHLAKGLPGRVWFQNLFAAPDETSGYAAWMLPYLRYYVEHGDRAGFETALERYATLLDELETTVRAVFD